VDLGRPARAPLGTPERAALPHGHAAGRLEDGRALTCNAPRRSGRLAVIAADATAAETAAGIDALSPALTAEFLHARSRRHGRTTVKSLLMDQREIAGLGNIYVNEILFRAGIRPRRRARRLTPAG